MAVLQMERIHICAMKRDRKKILELIQRRGTVEVSDAGGKDEVFDKMDTATARGLLRKNAETAQRALELLGKYAPAKEASLAFLRGRTAVSVQKNNDFYKKRDDVLRDAQRIVQLDRGIAEAKADLLRAEAGLEALAPWMKLPVPQTFTGTKKTAVFIGALEGEHALSDILESMVAARPTLDPVHVEIVSKEKNQTAFYAIVLKKDAVLAEEALRAIGFTRPASPSHRLPSVKQKVFEERIAAAQKTVQDAQKEIETYGDERQDIRFLQDHMEMRAEKYSAIERLMQSHHVFVLSGFIPQQSAAALQDELTRAFTCEVDILPVGEHEDEPILLKNSWFTEPTESVLESYSLPSKGELDPVGIMGIFYYIMFGLMFSDAGYGLILAGVCGVCLLAFKNMEPNWSKNIRMFFWCGVSTIFWGVVFSSYFGDVVNAVSKQFFGNEVGIPPLWFAPLEDPMKLLFFCLAIGIVHLTVGYIMKGITCAKNGSFLDILYDAVFPIVVLYPLVVILLGSDMFAGMAGFKLTLPPVVTNVCLIVSGICMVGVLFTGGRESKNWFKRILKGAYALYNVLAGWLSDILSYSRLLALGLATGVIASVINQLGGMFGVGVVGVIGFVLVFVVGHGINFGINVLGAYVHSNRLEYVEFFGKFYEGGGRKFNPFGIHTKYYKIEEETQNV